MHIYSGWESGQAGLLIGGQVIIPKSVWADILLDNHGRVDRHV